jgi:hypothetical protein
MGGGGKCCEFVLTGDYPSAGRTPEIEMQPTLEKTFTMQNQHTGLGGFHGQAKNKWICYAV